MFSIGFLYTHFIHDRISLYINPGISQDPRHGLFAAALSPGDDLQCCQPEAPGRQRRVEGLGRLPALGVLVTEAARLSNLEPEFMVTKNDDLVGFTGIS